MNSNATDLYDAKRVIWERKASTKMSNEVTLI